MGLLSFAEARAQLLAGAAPLSAERVPVVSASGRVLSEHVIASLDLPTFDHSSMDGYAVRVADVEASRTLPVRGESRAGVDVDHLEKGAACRIFTGAKLPVGADAVIMQEDAKREGDSVTFSKVPTRFGFVRRAGDDVRKGEIVLRAGTRLSPYALALLSALERTQVIVTRRPRVTILCTGDELREAGDAAFPGSIVDACGPAIAALAERTGASVRRAPFVRDDAEATKIALQDALATSDIVLTVGGVSVGDHDEVQGALIAAGATVDFWKVAIKPGKPLLVARRGSTHVLGLPGNPTSALLTFTLFGVPLIRALGGEHDVLPETFRARLGKAIRREPGRMEFIRATLRNGVATALANQASGAATSMALADVLIVIAAEISAIDEGTEVDVLRLADGGG